MARYQVTLAYDGSRFSGSQRQLKIRTVQVELEKSLRRLGWHGRSILMAGRTDTGVHAAGQVAAFDLDWQHNESRLVNALNAGLPDDLAVRKAKVAAADFHPRFDARSRSYRYALFCQPVRDPLREHLAWRVWPAVDGAALKQAAALFIGTHDFSSYGSATSPDGTTFRAVSRSEWKQVRGGWQFEVEADAFLYRMVRRLVFVQVAVGQGKLSAEAVERSLAGRANTGKHNELPAGLAPAHGLTLAAVTY
jgi:tRNA pseudouridine38-40 synthase